MEILKRSGKFLPKLGASFMLSKGVVRRTLSPNLEICYEFCVPKHTLSLSSRSFSNNRYPPEGDDVSNDEFTPLDIIRSKNKHKRRGGPMRKREKREVAPPRYLKMPTDQDWPSVWPTAKTFHPATVPLPLHQGYVDPLKGIAPPNKFANLELMKIPNFLHLTPPAIKRHCEAIKKFCTPWPAELKDDYIIENLFPIEIITNDYCHSSPSIRDPKGRIVTLRIKLDFFKLDEHAKDKFLRLVGERYNPKTDELTLVTDCCPLKKQNYDYSMYLLTALYHESVNKESWEGEKSLEDMEKYVWEGSKSQETLQQVLGPENLEIKAKLVEDYKNATEGVLNQGETSERISEYGDAVRKLLNLPPASANLSRAIGSQ